MVQRASPEDYFNQGGLPEQSLPEQNSLPARVNNVIEDYNPNTELVFALYALIVFAIVVIILAMIYFKSKER